MTAVLKVVHWRVGGTGTWSKMSCIDAGCILSMELTIVMAVLVLATRGPYPHSSSPLTPFLILFSMFILPLHSCFLISSSPSSDTFIERYLSSVFIFCLCLMFVSSSTSPISFPRFLLCSSSPSWSSSSCASQHGWNLRWVYEMCSLYKRETGLVSLSSL